MKITVENVYAPMDQDDTSSEGLLAVIISTSDMDGEVPNGPHFLTDPSLPLQVAVIGHDAGERVQPHYHPPHKREMTGTPEALLVVTGSYRMTIFTTRGVEVGSYILPSGTFVLLVSGGHGFIALEDESGMIEVKVGPYLADRDKVRY